MVNEHYVHCNQVDVLGLGPNLSFLWHVHLLALFLFTEISSDVMRVTLA